MSAKSFDLFVLRNECMSDGEFVVRHPGKVLQGAAIFVSNRSEEECKNACLKDDRCKSINIDSVHGTGCELNSKIAGDNGTDFIIMAGWTYISTNFTAKQVKLPFILSAHMIEQKTFV